MLLRVLIGDILSPVGSRAGTSVRDAKHAAGPVASAPGFLRDDTGDQRGGAPAHERALEASAARMAKRSAQAVSGGHEGRRERLASGQGYLRAAAALRKDPTSCRPFLGGPPPAGAHGRLPAAGWQ